MNVDKRQMIYEVIAKIKLYQNEGYRVPRMEPLASYLESLPRLNEDVLYELSLVLEPRDGSGPSPVSPGTSTSCSASSIRFIQAVKWNFHD